MHHKYLQEPMTQGEVERYLEKNLLHKRFTIHELEEIIGQTPVLGGEDFDFFYEELEKRLVRNTGNRVVISGIGLQHFIY